MTLEHEVKFELVSFAPIREALRSLGAVFGQRSLEHNLVLDDRERSLTRRGRLLRLRRDVKNTLTFKAPPGYGEAGESTSGLKVMRETETEVADLGALTEVFAALGYEPVLRYEKIRESWRAGGLTVCLDLLPFGRFAEIEGPPGDIAPLAVSLGLSMESALVQTYHDLHRRRAVPGANDSGADFLFDRATRERALTKRGLALLMENGENDPGVVEVGVR
jgi:adenylate cyclase class 2